MEIEVEDQFTRVEGSTLATPGESKELVSEYSDSDNESVTDVSEVVNEEKPEGPGSYKMESEPSKVEAQGGGLSTPRGWKEMVGEYSDSDDKSVTDISEDEDENKPDGPASYKMESEPSGKCMIFNHTFENSVYLSNKKLKLEKRPGTEHDMVSLQQTFDWLGFKVEIHKDASKEDMIRLLSTDDHVDYDAFVCCILSHGYEGGIYASDGNRVDIEELTSCVNGYNCKTLVDKPKLFFVQACQGEKAATGVPSNTQCKQLQSDSRPTNVSDTSVLKTISHSQADVSFFMSTTQGNISWRDPKSGSWFIQQLCTTLQKKAEHYSLDVVYIIVNKELAKKEHPENQNFRQISFTTHTLTSKLFFKVKKPWLMQEVD